LRCDISDFKSKTAGIIFTGDYSDVNDYYLGYHNQMGSKFEQNRPFFMAGDTLKDFNRFPAVADSLTQLSLDFLSKYDKKLPSWFKEHEAWRLKYLSGFLKYNVLLSKEFYGGQKINVSERYFSFANDLPLANMKMVLNTEYLWYAHFYLGEKTKGQSSAGVFDPEISLIDSMKDLGETGDILKMQRLSYVHRSSKHRYDSLYQQTSFIDVDRKNILDSLLKAKFSLPLIGEVAPKLTLTNAAGETVSLDNYKGNFVIINFWATWCGPCIREFPFDNEVHQTYKDKGLIVVNICVDSEMDTWKSTSREKNLQTINLFTPHGDYKKISAKFDINGLPKSVLLDRNSVVLNNDFKRASLLTKEDLDQIIK
jgi:thiol-disulfide isomerase/thioredoxin